MLDQDTFCLEPTNTDLPWQGTTEGLRGVATGGVSRARSLPLRATRVSCQLSRHSKCALCTLSKSWRKLKKTSRNCLIRSRRCNHELNECFHWFRARYTRLVKDQASTTMKTNQTVLSARADAKRDITHTLAGARSRKNQLPLHQSLLHLKS